MATAAAGGCGGGGPKKDIKLFIILITFMCPYEQGPTTTSGPLSGLVEEGVWKNSSTCGGKWNMLFYFKINLMLRGCPPQNEAICGVLGKIGSLLVQREHVFPPDPQGLDEGGCYLVQQMEMASFSIFIVASTLKLFPADIRFVNGLISLSYRFCKKSVLLF